MNNLITKNLIPLVVEFNKIVHQFANTVQIWKSISIFG